MLTQISKCQSATIHEDYDTDDNVKQSGLLSTIIQRVHMIQLI